VNLDNKCLNFFFGSYQKNQENWTTYCVCIYIYTV